MAIVMSLCIIIVVIKIAFLQWLLPLITRETLIIMSEIR